MEKNWPVLLVSLILIAAVGFWGYSQYTARQRLENYLSNQYQQSFYQLISAVEGAQVTAAKSLVSASPRENIINLTDLWRQSNIAKSNLDNIPIEHPTLSRTSQFLTQLGDYAYSLARQLAKGRPTTDQQWEKLGRLREEAAYLSTQLHQAQDETVDQLANRWGEMVQNTRRQVQESADRSINTFFDRIDKQMVQYPTLIYDGPFSDHVLNVKPKGLEGGNIDENQAEEAARRFVSFQRAEQMNVKTRGKVEGRIPAYHVVVEPQGSGRNIRADINVSRQGGQVISFLTTRSIGETTIDLNRAKDIAKKFLADRGFEDMIPSYQVQGEGSAVIVYVNKEDGVVVYPDQVKVKVALDNGEVIGFDAFQYYMAHRDRDFPEPKITAEEARRMVNPRLQVEKVTLALIPLPTLAEVLCWEVKSTLNGETYLVYLNAETGEEEQVLQVVDAKEGTLVI
ncbi:MAG: germination protein YpeB [Firmicutes bacterium]|nr:germination protein YpeB [Bacillota bacterium]